MKKPILQYAKGMKPIVIGNWKMNITSQEAKVYLGTFLRKLEVLKQAEVTLCPAGPVIPTVAQMLEGTGVAWGSQNAHWEERGAFTGEVSMEILQDLGCRLVLCGHSERRKWFKESDFEISRKVEQALAHNIVPVLCVGETFDERKAQKHEVVVIEQVRKGTERLSNIPALALIVAYEPVWAIGTGQAIEPEQAWEMARLIRSVLREVLPSGAESVPIIYGGSVNEINVASFVDGDAISGVLVGGTSLDPEKFHQLIAQLI
ncbi:triose-phosphate isomerase [Candidatus Parcubacteria bacterium]|nr:MAG: triose-phosphate isomerase [Candidatus Parcubacteria bacterium]